MQAVKLLHTTITSAFEGQCSECGEWNYFELSGRAGDPSVKGTYACVNCGHTEQLFFGQES